MSDSYEWPAHFLDLKREIISATSEERLTASWNDVLAELAKRTAEIAQDGSESVCQVNFADLDKLTPEEVDVIKRKGSVVVHGVVDSEMASGWKTELDRFIRENTHAEDLSENEMQFFHIYWSRQQVQARAHPNVLKASTWMSNLYHIKSGKTLDGVDLSVPLVYAERFRIRRPGGYWGVHPPHVDSGAIERWEDEGFRRCFEDIFNGNWRQNDPYDLENRLGARIALYERPAESTMFRTFQGWLAMSETGPREGTLRVFPDIKLSNAYIMLRPFFLPTVPLDSPDILDPENWKFDISTADFPGIYPERVGTGYGGPKPTPLLHPHLKLDQTMISIPKVNPGDMVFWHCDTLHSVETENIGNNDSAVMYLSAFPKTPENSAYVAKQAQAFLAGRNPPDFAKLRDGSKLVGLGTEADVKEPISRVAMGLPIEAA